MAKRSRYLHGKEFDPSKRAQSTLDAVLKEDETPQGLEVLDKGLKKASEKREKEVPKEKEEETIGVHEALGGSPVLQYVSDRSSARLLIFSRDESLLEEGSASDKRMREIAGLFGEVHIVVLLKKHRKYRQRRGHNLWLYTTANRIWWLNIFKAIDLAKQELVFANGFHADIIIAEDPFECGVAGYLTAEEFDRPFQIHLKDDFFSKQFAELENNNNWRLFLARYVMKRVPCVRVQSTYLKERVVEKYKDLEEYTEVLPTYYNLKGWQEAKPTFDLHTRYPQFKFIILHPTRMRMGSNTALALRGMSRVLRRHPSVGLVIVGEGPENVSLKKEVMRLELQNQVVFEPIPSDMTSHMKTANVLLHTSEEPDEEVSLIHAAAVELPIVSILEGLSGELFVDGVSAFLCPIQSPPCFGEKVNRLLNENPLRVDMALRAKDVVFSRIEQDYGTYLEAYKASIERCLIA